jgi:hypothetical protein
MEPSAIFQLYSNAKKGRTRSIERVRSAISLPLLQESLQQDSSDRFALGLTRNKRNSKISGNQLAIFENLPT